MGLVENLVLVFVAGLVTALATGVGVLPFFVVEEFSDRWTVALWGLASGIMAAASLLGLVREGLEYGSASSIAVGALAGGLLVVVGHRILDGVDHHPRQYPRADVTRLVVILGVLTVHSFPEGVAIGVSFAELGLEGAQTVALGGFALPVLAVFMTLAISVHNVPEGVAVAIPLRSLGVSEWRMVWWAVFSSLPQPIGAVLAFSFVTLAESLLPVGFGFAAGAMVSLVATEFLPEGLAAGADLPGRGRRELLAGVLAGASLMLPLSVI